MTKIIVGDWRDDSTGPMEVVSGPYGREKVHYSASPAPRVATEMDAFLRWFNAPLNERQIKVLNRLLDGFEGKMTSSKWAVIAKCSQDTASRDIAMLIGLGLLRKGEGGGRSTHYGIVI